MNVVEILRTDLIDLHMRRLTECLWFWPIHKAAGWMPMVLENMIKNSPLFQQMLHNVTSGNLPRGLQIQEFWIHEPQINVIYFYLAVHFWGSPFFKPIPDHWSFPTLSPPLGLTVNNRLVPGRYQLWNICSLWPLSWNVSLGIFIAFVAQVNLYQKYCPILTIFANRARLKIDNLSWSFLLCMNQGLWSTKADVSQRERCPFDVFNQVTLHDEITYGSEWESGNLGARGSFH